MAAYLILNGMSGGSWRLPAGTDLDELRAQVAAVMRTGKVIEVTVEMNNDPRQRTQVLVNGRALAQAVVAELDDSGNLIS